MVSTTSDGHLRDATEIFSDCGICLVIVESFLFPLLNHAVVGEIVPGRGVTILHDPNPDNGDRQADEYRIQEIIFIY